MHFLKLPEVEGFFVEDIMSDCPSEQNCQKFADFLVENCVTSKIKVPPEMWAGILYDEKRTDH